MRALANYGSDRRYHNIYQGYNCRLDPIQASFLRIKLAHIDAETAHRRSIAAVYNSEIRNSAVTLPQTDTPRHIGMAPVCGAHSHRDSFCRMLADNGVGYDIHYASTTTQATLLRALRTSFATRHRHACRRSGEPARIAMHKHRRCAGDCHDYQPISTMTSKPKALYHTFGCKLNFAETASVEKDIPANAGRDRRAQRNT